MPNTYEVGKKLVDLCKQGKNREAIDTLYAPDMVAIEAMSMPDSPQRQQGIAAVRAKNDWWTNNHEVHSAEVHGPFPNGDKFIVHFNYDVTSKDGPMKGQRIKMDEAGLYTVKDGKIVQEEFFYHMP